jgi:hypothetical protein
LSEELYQTPVFIVSAGRSGSTFLAKLVNQHPEIVCVSDLFEPVGPAPYFDKSTTLSGQEFFNVISAPSTKPRLRYWRERQTKERLFIPEDENLVSLLLSYTIPFLDDDPLKCLHDYKGYALTRPDQSPADHLIDFFEWLRRRFNGKLWVERTGGALPLTPNIIETWPEAKVVHNYRDGRECSISMQNYPFFRMYLKMIDNPDLDEWDFDEVYPIEEFGKMWSDWVVVAENALKTVPDEKKRWISYEDIMENPNDTLADLIKYILEKDVLSSTDEKWLNRCSEQINPSPKKFLGLNTTEQESLYNACEPGLKLLGYK